MNNDLIYLLSLLKVPTIGGIHAKILLNIFGNAQDIFKAPKRQLEKIDGLGNARIKNIKAFNDFDACIDEINFMEKFNITPLIYTQPAYPRRLLHCYDSPILLFYKGNADLNAERFVAIVGTRNNSEYGRKITEQLVENLKPYGVVIISGLALGIDTIAHKASVKNNMQTIGVLAHGLDRIYPANNKTLAKEMMNCGGLITEFRNDSNPDRENFPKRNRIVAGMCDCIVVIESGIKGGSLITADLANGYNRDVFAVPGRITDEKSEGCNFLIKNNKASLITEAKDIADIMNWTGSETTPRKKQRELFPVLTDHEKNIYDIITADGTVSVDHLQFKCSLPVSALAAGLLSLEMQGLIETLPGKMYRTL